MSGTYTRVVSVRPAAPSLQWPAVGSSRAPNTLPESKRGRHIQVMSPCPSTSAAEWQSDKKARPAISVDRQVLTLGGYPP